MNPYAEAGPSPDSLQSPYSVLNPFVDTHPPAPAAHTSELPSDDGGRTLVTASDPDVVVEIPPPGLPSADSPATPNPYPPAAVAPPSWQVSLVAPSPEVRPSPLPSPSSEDTCPDLECSICFSQFNNVFRCPKMLQCKHTFCLECLARMNVKSAEPGAIQCPLCRGLTPLPALGLPRLATDSDVLSCLPAAMQRVYSIRFLRSKGKLQVKRSSDGQQRRGQRSLTLANRTLDVGLPSPPPGTGEPGGALFRLTSRPACRALLLTSLVVMMVLLTGIIIFIIMSPTTQD